MSPHMTFSSGSPSVPQDGGSTPLSFLVSIAPRYNSGGNAMAGPALPFIPRGQGLALENPHLKVPQSSGTAGFGSQAQEEFLLLCPH